MTTSKADIRKIYERSRRMIKGDDESDPIKRQFNKYGVREGARLRHLYDAKQTAEAIVGKLEQQIVDAEQQLYGLAARARQLRPEAGSVTADTPLPTDEMADEYQRLHTKAEMTRSVLEAWQIILQGCKMQRGEESRIFENHYRDWSGVMWYLTGEAEFRPQIMYFEPGDQVLDDHRRAHLERRKAQIEG